MASRAGTVALFVLKSIARAIWVSTMVLTPLFGFWLASSLAAYHNATQWFALLVGALLFPILPVGWDLIFVWRRGRRGAARPAILTRLDRFVLRTLIINGLFLGGMMWQAKQESFRALAVRGDWMLEGFDGPIASTMRGFLLGFADRLDKRTVVEDHRYGESDVAPEDIKPDDKPLPVAEERTDPNAWPLPATIDPIVTAMPESEQTSVEAVGAYLAARITDKKQLVKALHDYVITRLQYDYDTLKLLEAKDYANAPPQTAEAVFAKRAGVCAGYARLMSALGKAAGVEIAYVTGYIRDSDRRLSISDDPWDTSREEALEGVRHAWNAAKIDDRWYLIDATWNDPSNFPTTTTYLFTPPKLMAFDHFPEDPAWQLVENPISLGDFVRQPLLSPEFGALGLTLISPTRSQVTVSGEVTIVVDNPRGAELMAKAERGKHETDCKVQRGAKTTITCTLADGEYAVKMYAAPASRVKAGRYTLDYVGAILVNSH